MKSYKKYFPLTFLVTLLSSISVFAQDSIGTQPVQMADGMRADGKIYVVVVVILIIFTGIIIYLISLDKKVSAIEKEIKSNKEK
ncbi:MAG TPA: CcmD family protein [Bacteroidia bacterium]|nr:CcmD family protein [Bacteroidia bacterium]